MQSTGLFLIMAATAACCWFVEMTSAQTTTTANNPIEGSFCLQVTGTSHFIYADQTTVTLTTTNTSTCQASGNLVWTLVRVGTYFYLSNGVLYLDVTTLGTLTVTSASSATQDWKWSSVTFGCLYHIDRQQYLVATDLGLGKGFRVSISPNSSDCSSITPVTPVVAASAVPPFTLSPPLRSTNGTYCLLNSQGNKYLTISNIGDLVFSTSCSASTLWDLIPDATTSGGFYLLSRSTSLYLSHGYSTYLITATSLATTLWSWSTTSNNPQCLQSALTPTTNLFVSSSGTTVVDVPGACAAIKLVALTGSASAPPANNLTPTSGTYCLYFSGVNPPYLGFTSSGVITLFDRCGPDSSWDLVPHSTSTFYLQSVATGRYLMQSGTAVISSWNSGSVMAWSSASAGCVYSYDSSPLYYLAGTMDITFGLLAACQPITPIPSSSFRAFTSPTSGTYCLHTTGTYWTYLGFSGSSSVTPYDTCTMYSSWVFQYRSTGTFYLQNAGTGRYLTISGSTLSSSSSASMAFYWAGTPGCLTATSNVFLASASSSTVVLSEASCLPLFAEQSSFAAPPASPSTPAPPSGFNRPLSGSHCLQVAGLTRYLSVDTANELTYHSQCVASSAWQVIQTSTGSSAFYLRSVLTGRYLTGSLSTISTTPSSSTYFYWSATPGCLYTDYSYYLIGTSTFGFVNSQSSCQPFYTTVFDASSSSYISPTFGTYCFRVSGYSLYIGVSGNSVTAYSTCGLYSSWELVVSNSASFYLKNVGSGLYLTMVQATSMSLTSSPSTFFTWSSTLAGCLYQQDGYYIYGTNPFSFVSSVSSCQRFDAEIPSSVSPSTPAPNTPSQIFPTSGAYCLRRNSGVPYYLEPTVGAASSCEAISTWSFIPRSSSSFYLQNLFTARYIERQGSALTLSLNPTTSFTWEGGCLVAAGGSYYLLYSLGFASSPSLCNSFTPVLSSFTAYNTFTNPAAGIFCLRVSSTQNRYLSLTDSSAVSHTNRCTRDAKWEVQPLVNQPTNFYVRHVSTGLNLVGDSTTLWASATASPTYFTWSSSYLGCIFTDRGYYITGTSSFSLSSSGFCQSFYVEPAGSTAPVFARSAPLSEGLYCIQNATTFNFLSGASASLLNSAASCNSSSWWGFERSLTSSSNDVFYIKSLHSFQYLTRFPSSTSVGLALVKQTVWKWNDDGCIADATDATSAGLAMFLTSLSTVSPLCQQRFQLSTPLLTMPSTASSSTTSSLCLRLSASGKYISAMGVTSPTCTTNKEKWFIVPLSVTSNSTTVLALENAHFGSFLTFSGDARKAELSISPALFTNLTSGSCLTIVGNAFFVSLTSNGELSLQDSSTGCAQIETISSAVTHEVLIDTYTYCFRLAAGAYYAASWALNAPTTATACADAMAKWTIEQDSTAAQGNYYLRNNGNNAYLYRNSTLGLALSAVATTTFYVAGGCLRDAHACVFTLSDTALAQVTSSSAFIPKLDQSMDRLCLRVAGGGTSQQFLAVTGSVGETVINTSSVCDRSSEWQLIITDDTAAAVSAVATFALRLRSSLQQYLKASINITAGSSDLVIGYDAELLVWSTVKQGCLTFSASQRHIILKAGLWTTSTSATDCTVFEPVERTFDFPQTVVGSICLEDSSSSNFLGVNAVSGESLTDRSCTLRAQWALVPTAASAATFYLRNIAMGQYLSFSTSAQTTTTPVSTFTWAPLQPGLLLFTSTSGGSNGSFCLVSSGLTTFTASRLDSIEESSCSRFLASSAPPPSSSFLRSGRVCLWMALWHSYLSVDATRTTLHNASRCFGTAVFNLIGASSAGFYVGTMTQSYVTMDSATGATSLTLAPMTLFDWSTLPQTAGCLREVSSGAYLDFKPSASASSECTAFTIVSALQVSSRISGTFCLSLTTTLHSGGASFFLEANDDGSATYSYASCETTGRWTLHSSSSATNNNDGTAFYLENVQTRNFLVVDSGTLRMSNVPTTHSIFQWSGACLVVNGETHEYVSGLSVTPDAAQCSSFSLISASSTPATPTPTSGPFCLSTVDTRTLLTSVTKAQLSLNFATCGASPSSVWVLQSLSSSVFFLRNLLTEQFLDVTTSINNTATITIIIGVVDEAPTTTGWQWSTVVSTCLYHLSTQRYLRVTQNEAAALVEDVNQCSSISAFYVESATVPAHFTTKPESLPSAFPTSGKYCLQQRESLGSFIAAYTPVANALSGTNAPSVPQSGSYPKPTSGNYCLRYGGGYIGLSPTGSFVMLSSCDTFHAVWAIEPVSGGFYLRNVGTNFYLVQGYDADGNMAGVGKANQDVNQYFFWSSTAGCIYLSTNTRYLTYQGYLVISQSSCSRFVAEDPPNSIVAKTTTRMDSSCSSTSGWRLVPRTVTTFFLEHAAGGRFLALSYAGSAILEDEGHTSYFKWSTSVVGCLYEPQTKRYLRIMINGGNRIVSSTAYSHECTRVTLMPFAGAIDTQRQSSIFTSSIAVVTLDALFSVFLRDASSSSSKLQVATAGQLDSTLVSALSSDLHGWILLGLSAQGYLVTDVTIRIRSIFKGSVMIVYDAEADVDLAKSSNTTRDVKSALDAFLLNEAPSLGSTNVKYIAKQQSLSGSSSLALGFTVDNAKTTITTTNCELFWYGLSSDVESCDDAKALNATAQARSCANAQSRQTFVESVLIPACTTLISTDDALEPWVIALIVVILLCLVIIGVIVVVLLVRRSRRSRSAAEGDDGEAPKEELPRRSPLGAATGSDTSATLERQQFSAVAEEDDHPRIVADKISQGHEPHDVRLYACVPCGDKVDWSSNTVNTELKGQRCPKCGVRVSMVLLVKK